MWLGLRERSTVEAANPAQIPSSHLVNGNFIPGKPCAVQIDISGFVYSPGVSAGVLCHEVASVAKLPSCSDRDILSIWNKAGISYSSELDQNII